MCQQSIASIKHMRDGVSLVRSQIDFRVHAYKGNMGTVVLSGSCAVETLIVNPNQFFTPFRVFPYPFPKSVLDGLLFLLGQGGFLGVQHPDFLSVRVVFFIVDFYVTQVQRGFQQIISAGPRSAKRGISRHINIGDRTLIGDCPFGGVP